MTVSVKRAKRLFLFNKDSDSDVKPAVVIEAFNFASKFT